MIEAKVNNENYKVELEEYSNFVGTINSESFDFEIISQIKNNYSMKMDDIIFDVDIISTNDEYKVIELLVNGKFIEIELHDNYDRLIEKLGLDKKKAVNIKSIISPMPGLVISVLVKKNDSIVEGQQLIVLEAMKMENIIKSTTSGKVGEIYVSDGDAVEKNETLIKLK